MSITIKSAPNNYPTAHENLWHVADSTNKTADDFQYVWDIYKGGVLQARLKTRPEGANDYGKVDASIVVRSLLADSVPVNINYEVYGTYSELATDVFFTQYTMAVGEYASGNVSGNLVSGNYTAYNSAERSVASKLQKLLSSRPSNSTTVAGQPLVMTFFTEGGDDYVINKTERKNGATVATDSFTQTPNSTFAVNLSATSSTADSMELEVDTDDSLGPYYYYFKVLCEAKYTARTLMFLNRWGGWDSYTFALKSQRSIEATRRMYEQNQWVLSGDNVVDTHNTYTKRAGRTVYGTKYKTSMELNAYQMNTDEYTWLEELITSPAVYLWDSTANVWHPVMITETNYRPLDVRLDKGETLKINIEYANDNITQHR